MHFTLYTRIRIVFCTRFFARAEYFVRAEYFTRAECFARAECFTINETI